jgi:hypothetical protein
MLPWDSDIDTQVSQDTLGYMAAHLNQSIFHYVSDDGKGSVRKYVLDINPFSRLRQPSLA